MEKSCKNCEFNFGTVCAGAGKRTDNKDITYGSKMEEMYTMFPNGCENWHLSPMEEIEEMKNKDFKDIYKTK